MRHSYTPLFGDFLTSSMWSETPAARCVWIWFLLSADPEGYVRGTLPGVAQHAGVSMEEARLAIELLESPDPHSNSKKLEGRRLVRVERGWHIVNFVDYRERARHEAEKARKRAWATKNYHAQKQPMLPGFEDFAPPVEVPPENLADSLDAPKPKPKPKTTTTQKKRAAPKKGKPAKKARGKKPAPPHTSPDTTPETAAPPPAPPELDTPVATETLPAVLHRLPEGFTPSDALRMDAVTAGVPDLDARIATLGTGPIGGSRGVFADQLEDYIRARFPDWRTWRETKDMKTSQERLGATQRGSGAAGAIGGASPGQGTPVSVPGYPAWVHPEHLAVAERYDISLHRAARAYAQQAAVPPRTMRPIDVRAPFREFLENLARQRQGAA